MTFDSFSQQIRSAGLVPKNCGNGHWQIRGGMYCVNFYPFARNGPSFYVNAMNQGARKVTIAEAILAASNLLHGRHPKTRRKRSYKRIREMLLAKHPYCRWCNKLLDNMTATLDHIIPLSKGGTNGLDNQTLACYDCNQNRRDSLPSRTEWQKLS